MRIPLFLVLAGTGAVSFIIATVFTLRFSALLFNPHDNNLSSSNDGDIGFPRSHLSLCLGHRPVQFESVYSSRQQSQPQSQPHQLQQQVQSFSSHDISDTDSHSWLSWFFGWLSSGEGWIKVVKSNAYHPSRSAHFGPRLSPDNALCGYMSPIQDLLSNAKDTITDNHVNSDGLLLRDVNLACNTSHFVNKTISNQTPTIALVQRGQCPFTTKVRNAQALGASGVIVGDDFSHSAVKKSWGFWGGRQSLVGMWGGGDTSDIKIPSTFVSYESYMDLVRLYRDFKMTMGDDHEPVFSSLSMSSYLLPGLEVIMSEEEGSDWPLTPLLLVLLFLPSLITFCTLLIHRLRIVQQRKRERAKPEEIAQLPWVFWGEWPSHYSSRSQAEKTASSSGLSTPRPTSRAGRASPGSHVDVDSLGNLSDIENGLVVNTPPASGWRSWFFPPIAPQPSLFAARHRSSCPPPVTGAATPPSTQPLPYSPSLVANIELYDECAICLSPFVKGDPVRVLPCWHVFHVNEVDEWLESGKGICPTCRHPITSPVEPRKQRRSRSLASQNTLRQSRNNSSPNQRTSVSPPSSPHDNNSNNARSDNHETDDTTTTDQTINTNQEGPNIPSSSSFTLEHYVRNSQNEYNHHAPRRSPATERSRLLP